MVFGVSVLRQGCGRHSGGEHRCKPGCERNGGDQPDRSDERVDRGGEVVAPDRARLLHSLGQTMSWR
jgi:hypothetical protein